MIGFLRIVAFAAHQALVGFVECFFCGEGDVDVAISLAVVDLFDDFEADALVLFDVVEPVADLAPELAADDLV